MTGEDFRRVRGFEAVWRPPVRPRHVRPETNRPPAPAEVRARLARVVARAPEVMVKVTGRTREAGHLAAHLSYVTRHGALAADSRDGPVVGAQEVRETARDWALMERSQPRRRANAPFSVAVLLSMPAGTDPLAVRDAAVQFAREAFGARHDYLVVLHTDTPHPHAHVAVRALGDDGVRLNPRKADLEAWRQRFAELLRARGLAAEATPRRARGVSRKAERLAVRKLAERAARGAGDVARTLRGAYAEAAKAAFGADRSVRPWEARLARRQAASRALYLAQARLLQASPDADDRRLGRAVEAFVQSMPPPDSRRLALARELRGANRTLEAGAARRARDL